MYIKTPSRAKNAGLEKVMMYRDLKMRTKRLNGMLRGNGAGGMQEDEEELGLEQGKIPDEPWATDWIDEKADGRKRKRSKGKKRREKRRKKRVFKMTLMSLRSMRRLMNRNSR